MIGLLLTKCFWVDLRGEQDSLSTTVRNVGLVIGGVIAILLAVWRSRIGERQADTAQQGLLNERYQKGAEMLGSDVLAVRMGGISALKRLAEEHPGQYHIQTMELLCAFVRNPTGSDSVHRKLYTEDAPDAFPTIREDVQAILTAVGGRGKVGLDLENLREGFRLDLRHANLGGANLYQANLANANLREAYLAHARLTSADLSAAYLTSADLHRGTMVDANLSGASMDSTDLSYVIAEFSKFSGADLSWAVLIYANLENANLSQANIGGADLTHARLKETNLSGVRFRPQVSPPDSGHGLRPRPFARLTQLQLDDAISDPDNPPRIPKGLVDIESGEQLFWQDQPMTAAQ